MFKLTTLLAIATAVAADQSFTLKAVGGSINKGVEPEGNELE